MFSNDSIRKILLLREECSRKSRYKGGGGKLTRKPLKSLFTSVVYLKRSDCAIPSSDGVIMSQNYIVHCIMLTRYCAMLSTRW